MSVQLLTIQYWLKKHATYRPNHIALVFEEKKITYKALYESVNQLSHAFINSGIKKGDKIVTILSNSIALYETYWACATIGAIAVPLSPLLREQGLINLLNNSDTKLVITSKDFSHHLNQVKNKLEQIPSNNYWIIDIENDASFQNFHQQKHRQPISFPEVEDLVGDDIYNIIYSSGTTGLPKGIVISHAVRALYGSLFSNAYRITPESVIMHSGSIIFNGSFLTLMPAMFMGCTYILQNYFDADSVIQIISKLKVTHTILVPTQIISCLNKSTFKKDNLASLECIISVGAPLLLEQKQELNKKIPEVFYELYGLTEGFMTILDKNNSMLKEGSVGTPPQFMDIKIVNENGENMPTKSIGEIVGKGPLLMTEYYKNPTQTSSAIKKGWLYTGDLGYLDSDGYLFLTGRKKDLIISGGVNVYPNDIEEILIRHSAIKDVAVFGVPHIEWGETPVAAVVLNEGFFETADEIKEWANHNVEARFQKIHHVILLTELPRNIAGKVLKTELKEKYCSN